MTSLFMGSILLLRPPSATPLASAAPCVARPQLAAIARSVHGRPDARRAGFIYAGTSARVAHHGSQAVGSVGATRDRAVRTGAGRGSATGPGNAAVLGLGAGRGSPPAAAVRHSVVRARGCIFVSAAGHGARLRCRRLRRCRSRHARTPSSSATRVSTTGTRRCGASFRPLLRPGTSRAGVDLQRRRPRTGVRGAAREGRAPRQRLPYTSLHLGFAAAPCVDGDPSWLASPAPRHRALARSSRSAPSCCQASRCSRGCAFSWISDRSTQPADRRPPARSSTDRWARSRRDAAAPRRARRRGRARPRSSLVSPVVRGGQTYRDALLLGSGWYPLGRGAGLLALHRAGPVRKDAAADARACCCRIPPAVLSPRCAYRRTRLDTDPAELGVAFVIAIETNQLPRRLRPRFSGLDYVCRGVGAVDEFISDSHAQWLVGAFADARSAEQALKALRIKGTSRDRAPPPGAAGRVRRQAGSVVAQETLETQAGRADIAILSMLRGRPLEPRGAKADAIGQVCLVATQAGPGPARSASRTAACGCRCWVGTSAARGSQTLPRTLATRSRRPRSYAIVGLRCEPRSSYTYAILDVQPFNRSDNARMCFAVAGCAAVRIALNRLEQRARSSASAIRQQPRSGELQRAHFRHRRGPSPEPVDHVPISHCRSSAQELLHGVAAPAAGCRARPPRTCATRFRLQRCRPARAPTLRARRAAAPLPHRAARPASPRAPRPQHRSRGR